MHVCMYVCIHNIFCMVAGGKNAKAAKENKENEGIEYRGGERSEEREKLQVPTATHTPHDLCQWLLRP